MSIISTVSGGRTHIAMGTRYGGSVNSYNHWFTRFVARVLRLSMTVTIDGKQRELNKKSYKKLLGSMGYQDVSLKDHKTLGSSVNSGHQLPDTGQIRDAISPRKKTRLCHKLAEAILQGNENEAVKAIYQGADLERSYDQIGDDRVHFGRFEKDLDKYCNHRFQVTTGTPWIHASRLQREAVRNALTDAGAQLNAIGSTYVYKRNITSIRRKWDFGVSFSMGIGLFGCMIGPFIGIRKRSEVLHVRKRKDIVPLQYSK